MSFERIMFGALFFVLMFMTIIFIVVSIVRWSIVYIIFALFSLIIAAICKILIPQK